MGRGHENLENVPASESSASIFPSFTFKRNQYRSHYGLKFFTQSALALLHFGIEKVQKYIPGIEKKTFSM